MLSPHFGRLFVLGHFLLCRLDESSAHVLQQQNGIGTSEITGVVARTLELQIIVDTSCSHIALQKRKRRAVKTRPMISDDEDADVADAPGGSGGGDANDPADEELTDPVLDSTVCVLTVTLLSDGAPLCLRGHPVCNISNPYQANEFRMWRYSPSKFLVFFVTFTK